MLSPMYVVANQATVEGCQRHSRLHSRPRRALSGGPRRGADPGNGVRNWLAEVIRIRATLKATAPGCGYTASQEVGRVRPMPRSDMPIPRLRPRCRSLRPRPPAPGQGGPTHASNLKCCAAIHHLIKTFWSGRRLVGSTTSRRNRDLDVPAGDTSSPPGKPLLFPPCAHRPATPTAETKPPPDAHHRGR